MHTSVDAGPGYREDRDLAGTSGRLGHDPERDYGRGGPIGGGTGYGGRQYEGSDRDRGQRFGGRDPRDMGPGPYGQGGPYGQSGPYGQGGLYGQPSYGQRSWRGEPQSVQTGQRRGPLNYQRSDQRIYEDVCDRLSDDDDLDVSNVEVKVDQGEVTVTGHVESRAMKRRIEDVVERVPHVKDVHVQVRVQRQGDRDQSRIGTQATGQTGTAAPTSNADRSAKPGPQGHTTRS
jgi:hypothetical protein